MNEAKIKIGAGCNNACVFCAALKEKYHRDLEYIAADIVRAKTDGFESLLITGLEPTVYPRFNAALEIAAKAGFGWIAVDTNARMFSYPDFALKAKKAGLKEARVLLPHHDEKKFERITGVAESYGQCVSGIRNLLKQNIKVAARIPVCEENLSELKRILEFAVSMGIHDASAYLPRDYFPAGGLFDTAVFENALKETEDFAGEKGMNFEFRRGSRIFQRLMEMDERTAVSFYPSSYPGRGRRPEILEALLRPTFACNQICRFCWVDTNIQKPSKERMLSEIDCVIEKRIPRLAFSGGEPTLDNNLSFYIGKAKDGGVRQTEIHTNAVRLASRQLCEELCAAGLDAAYCTILAPDAKTSDSITRTGNSFRKTLAGVTNLLTSGANVIIHTVINGDNFRLMPELVAFVDEQFSYGGHKLPISFSYAAPRDRRAMEEGVVPRFSDAMPYLSEALEECESRGVPYSAGEGLKGAPPCVMPFRDKYIKQYRVSTPNSPGKAFVKKSECLQCCFDDTCFGVRRHYANYCGMDEIRPVDPDPKRAAGKKCECC